jgi:hypothetical protein
MSNIVTGSVGRPSKLLGGSAAAARSSRPAPLMAQTVRPTPVGDREESVMSVRLHENLPDALRSVRTRPLFVMHLDVKPLPVVGATPGGHRRMGVVPSGAFEGERVSGVVLDGGSDWQSVRADGSTHAGCSSRTRDHGRSLDRHDLCGIRHGPANVLQRLERARRSIRQPTTSASIRCSRGRRSLATGSTTSSRLASTIAVPMYRYTACSKCCERLNLSPDLLGELQT